MEHSAPERSTRVRCGRPFRNQIATMLSVSVIVEISETV